MPKIAFCFAGQGAQYSGMGKDLYENSDSAKKVFDMAESFRKGTTEQCFTASLEEISITKNTQPCLFCVDLACAKALEENGIKADFVAGFSLGEIPALAFTGVLSEEDAFKLVTKRGELMQIAATENPGAMAAVLKLENEQVEEICRRYDRVFPVNYNCKGQLVIAGDSENIDKACADISAIKGRAKKLNVSGAFHTPFMVSASVGIKEMLGEMTLSDTNVPLYSNYTSLPYDGDKTELISNQLMNPVKWQQSVENMAKDGAEIFIEVGAGKTLSGLIKKIIPGAKVYNVQDIESLNKTVEEIKNV
ncbi:MAG: ACP S-malonyltransferase [Clostridia bacterium]